MKKKLSRYTEVLVGSLIETGKWDKLSKEARILFVLDCEKHVAENMPDQIGDGRVVVEIPTPTPSLELVTESVTLAEDIDFLAHQSSGKLNMIIAGMTALMRDNDSKVAQLESQNWFQRMIRTVTGKNKASHEEIQRNHDKINAYMSQAIAELYNRNSIDERIISSLRNQIAELDVYNMQLRQMLGAFVAKLNEKIESVDNFHIIVKEISQGVYTSGHHLPEICKVISQLDYRTLNDSRKLDIVRRELVSQGILSNKQIGLKDYLMQIVEISLDDAGGIYLELGTFRGNFMANIILAMMDDYYFLPDMARKMKNKPAMIADVIETGRLDEGITLSTSEIYDDFINSKIETVNGLCLL